MCIYIYIFIYHHSLRYKNLLGNATHPCKFHVIGSEIIYIYIYIYVYVCVHTLFLHAVVHVDESSSVFPLVHQEIPNLLLKNQPRAEPSLRDLFLEPTVLN